MQATCHGTFKILNSSARLISYNSACCRASLNAALARMGLDHQFAATVTAEDGMDTTSQQFLSAAIKLNRPPQDCVVFESSPQGIAAAHNCSCKVRPWHTSSLAALAGKPCARANLST